MYNIQLIGFTTETQAYNWTDIQLLQFKLQF